MARPPFLSYRLLSLLLFPFWIGHALWHSIRYHQGNYLAQRLGISPGIPEQVIWVHASSVGEVQLVKPLIQALAQEYPLLLTTFTATGFQHAQRIMPPQVLCRVLPIDFLPLSAIFVARHQIQLGLIAETELWPETLYQAAKQTRLVQVNARLSAKTLNSRGFIRRTLQRTLGYFTRYLTRNEEDVERLRALGANESAIRVCGNLKQSSDSASQDYPDLIGRPYLLFASTHAPEEQLFAQLGKDLGLDLLTVIAPRHPQRAAEILKVIRPLELSVAQRSKGDEITDTTELYLADTLGELKALMAHAVLIVMGGSFNDIGGHNVLEAAQVGKAVITGPSDDNIRADIDLLKQHNAITQVKDLEELAQQIQFLLEHPQRMHTLCNNAERAVQSQQHVVDDYLAEIRALLSADD